MEYQVQSPTGEMHVIEGPEGASDEEIAAQAQQLFGQSGLESFGRAALNNLPAGGQIGALGTAALKGEDYSKAMEEVNTKTAEAKAEHPVAYGAGAVTGAVAPLAIPGVGEAFAANPALAGGALGALNAVGNTDIVKNPQEALKQAALGGATGAAIGTVMPTGEKTAEGLEGFANRKAVQGLGLKPGMLGIPKEELEDLGQFAHEAGLTQGPLEQRVNTAKDLLQQTGAQIGGFAEGQNGLKNPIPFINQLHDLIKESSSIYGPESNQEAGLYRQAMANLSQPGLTFEELQKFKTAIGQRAFDGIGEVKNDAAANVYSIYKDAMKALLDESENPAYQEAMTAYSKLHDIHGALMNQFQREQALGPQMKGIGMIGRMGAAITGGNVPATAGAAGAAAATGHPLWALGLGATLSQNPTAMEAAARGAATTLPKVAATATAGGIDAVTSYLFNTLTNNPQKLGRYAQPLMQAAKSGGSQGLAAQHYILSTTHPEYNQMMQKQEGGSNEPEQTNR